MDACSHPETELRRAADDREGAANRTCRPVETGQEAIARGVQLLSVVELQVAADQRVVGLEQRTPASIAHLGGESRRVGDVGEHDRGQHSIERVCLPHSGQKFFDLAEDGV